MDYRIICGLLFALIILGTSCVDRQTGGESAQATETSTSENPSAVESASAPVETEAAAAETESVVEEETTATEKEQPAADEPGGEASAAEPEINGLWFALFTQDMLGLTSNTWDNGHRLEFFNNGQALWTLVANGVETETLDSQWSRTHTGLSLSFAAPRAVESGISRIAPMGIGKDEEIGLAKSSGGNVGNSAMSLFNTSLEVVVEENYLVLKDMQGRVTAYGRAPSEATRLSIPDITGNWRGHSSSQDDFAAEFSWNQAQLSLTGKFDNGRDQFKGIYTFGYWIGDVTGMNGTGIAAFTLIDDSRLDGIYCNTRNREIDTVYEFTRSH